MSDWDFDVEVERFDTFKADLPDLVDELQPLAHQWDPYGHRHNYMVMLSGPAKVDIIIEVPQDEARAWLVSVETLPRIEHHFWDWTLWLGGKTVRGEHDLVAAELTKMSERLLGPLGVTGSVATIEEAVTTYRQARSVVEEGLGVRSDRAIEREVWPALRAHGLV